VAEPFLGDSHMFAGNFAPRGYALCQGQLLPIAQNDALFSLLGTTFGGDGQTTFALPDLQGRVPMHQGQGPGLPSYVIGEASGSETVTLIGQQIPNHNHPAPATTQGASSPSPQGGIFAATTTNNELYAAPGAGPAAQLTPQTIGNSGGNQPHDNMMPFLVINFIIALEGVYPTQN
jgi:microcystin-dependent protein